MNCIYVSIAYTKNLTIVQPSTRACIVALLGCPCEMSRARPHLDANMEMIRNFVVHVPHTYWNRHMSSSVTWTVYITHVLPPANKNQLRMRLVAEARQTLADGAGEGMIIGPHVRLTKLLVELEKETKKENPPKYYQYRTETSRKACDQLKVSGMTTSPWLLKEYLQGEKLLTEAALPPRTMRTREFAPSFTDQQLQHLLAKANPSRSAPLSSRPTKRVRTTAPVLESLPEQHMRQRATNVRMPAGQIDEINRHTSAAETAIAASSTSARHCSRCEHGIFVSMRGTGDTGDIAVETGFACEQCQDAMCGNCAFQSLASFAQRRDLHESWQTGSVCICGTMLSRGLHHGRLFAVSSVVVQAAWFASAATLRECRICAPYIVAEGTALDVESLERDLSRIHDERLLREAWMRCFDTAFLHRCGNDACRALTLDDSTSSTTVKCTFCDTETCAVCGSTTQPHVCGMRRPALRTLAQDSTLPWAADHALESCLHTIMHMLSVPCHARMRPSDPPCTCRVFVSVKTSRCAVCNASCDISSTVALARQKRCVSTILSRLNTMAASATPFLQPAEEEVASTVGGAKAYQAQHVKGQIAHALRRSPVFAGMNFVDRERIIDELHCDSGTASPCAVATAR